MGKDRLEKEMKRVEEALRSKSGKYIEEELRQYLKLLKRELKDKRRNDE